MKWRKLKEEIKQRKANKNKIYDAPAPPLTTIDTAWLTPTTQITTQRTNDDSKDLLKIETNFTDS